MSNRNSYIFLSILAGVLFVGCTAGSGGSNQAEDSSTDAASQVGVPSVQPDREADLMIGREPCCSVLLLDADGDFNHSARTMLSKNDVITYHYQRVACSSDTCRQEFVTYSAVEYPRDSVLQIWMADVLSHFYYDATRQIDVEVNGDQLEYNEDGEVVSLNTGCRPYEGILGDGGKTMFDYYQARMWVIGKGREADQHGPVGRYGCAIYRCWQSSDYVSYFVGYSTDEPQWPVHYVTTFNRSNAHPLDLTDIVNADNMAEFYDMVADAAHERHYRLLHSRNCELAIEPSVSDYASSIDIKAVGFVDEGLAVSTGALAFDQWAAATHVLIIPYEKVNALLLPQYRF